MIEGAGHADGIFWARRGDVQADGAAGLTCKKHIFVADRGDYYGIPEGVQQVEGHG